MRNFVKSLSAGERFSALIIAAAFLGVMIPAAITYTSATAPTFHLTLGSFR